MVKLVEDLSKNSDTTDKQRTAFSKQKKIHIN